MSHNQDNVSKPNPARLMSTDTKGNNPILKDRSYRKLFPGAAPELVDLRYNHSNIRSFLALQL